MYVRSVLLIGTTVVGMLSASDAQAGCFGKRKCCQETPVVCPQACCTQQTSSPIAQSNCPTPAPAFSYTDSLGTPKILVERQRKQTRIVNGVAVTETVVEMGEASPEEARNIINQKLDSITTALAASGSDSDAIREVNGKIGTLQRAVFGDKDPPKNTTLESRVENLEKK